MNSKEKPIAYPIIDWPLDYFLQHEEDVRTLLSHMDFYCITDLSEMAVLEIGAGQGMHSGFLSNHFKSIYATDIFNFQSLRGGKLATYILEM
mgnify:CR=1 FL=1